MTSMEEVSGAVDRIVPLFALADREATLHALVGGGGALLVLYAGWARTTARATAVQGRGLAAAGSGFLLSAAASMALREAGPLGAGVSLAGSALVLWGMLALVRERQALRDHASRAGRQGSAGSGDWAGGA